MENIQKNFFRQIDLLISRVFWSGLFFNFLAHCELYQLHNTDIYFFILAESDERIFAIRCQGGNLYEGQYGTIEKNPRGPFRIFL